MPMNRRKTNFFEGGVNLGVQLMENTTALEIEVLRPGVVRGGNPENIVDNLHWQTVSEAFLGQDLLPALGNGSKTFLVRPGGLTEELFKELARRDESHGKFGLGIIYEDKKLGRSPLAYGPRGER